MTVLKEEAAKAGLEFRIEQLDPTASFKKVQEKKHDVSFTAFGIGPAQPDVIGSTSPAGWRS